MTTDLTLAEALDHFRNGRLADAERLCQEVLAGQPENAEALRAIGIIAFQSGNLAAAESYLRRAVTHHPDDARAHNNLGGVFQSNGRHADAEAAFQRALDCDPLLADAHFNLGLHHHQAGRTAEAAGHYRRTLDLEPGMAEARQNLARLDEQKAAAFASTTPSAAEREAADLYRQGHLEEALAVCRQILETHPDHVEALNFAAAVALEMDDTLQAIAYLKTALGRQPTYVDARVNLGNALRKQDNMSAAIEEYERAIEIEPNHAAAHANLGNALHRSGKSDQAADSYRRSVELNPGLASAYNDLGTVLQELDDNDGAIAAYRRAGEATAGGHAGAAYNLARLLQAQGRNDDALAAFRDVLAIDPSHPNAAHMVAALTGQRTEMAPRGYVRDLFDFYADNFDEHLTEKAGYRVPRLMRELIDRLALHPTASEDFQFQCGLDLGCGTGLVGENFTDLVGEFIAVDLAPKMVAQATLKGVYDDIHECELLEYFDRFSDPSEPFDLVLGGDLFIYIGKLDELFAAISTHMATDGLFVFSVETLDDGDYALLQSGRYAQSEAYIETLAAAHGFRIEVRDSIVVRHGPINGAIFVLVKV